MNNKHLLVKCITLLYQESLLPIQSQTSSGIVERILEQIQLPEVTTGLDTEREILQNLMKTIRSLLRHNSEPISLTELNQQVIIDCGEDISTREAIQAGLQNVLEEKEIQTLCASIRRDLNQFMRDERGKQIVIDYANKIRYKANELPELSKVFQSLSGELEPYLINGQEEDPAVVASFGLTDKEEIEEVFNRIKERNEGRGGFRFGFKGINRFFKGNIESGKAIVIGALMHQHKTGFSLALFRQLLMYNIPIIKEWREYPRLVTVVNEESTTETKLDTSYSDEAFIAGDVSFAEVDEAPVIVPGESEDFVDTELSDLGDDPSQEESECDKPTLLPYTEEQAIFYDDPILGERVPVRLRPGVDPFMGGVPKRIPCMIRISTEDEIEDNMEKLYRDTYGNVTGEAPDMRLITTREMQEYLAEQLGRNGWYAHFMRINPSDWTYQNIIQVVLDMEAKGYDVQVVMVDYLPMIPTTGCEQGPAGHDLRDMYRRIRNFMSARDILFISPHQLSSEAMRLLRQGVDNFVKQMPDRNYYAGSTQISHEVDGEIFIHIEKVNGESWLTCQRGKYRSPKVVDDKDKYVALPFHPEIGLQDDLLIPELGRRTIGATVSETGEEVEPFWA